MGQIYIALTACTSSQINQAVINLWRVTSNQALDCEPIYIFFSMTLFAMPSNFLFPIIQDNSLKMLLQKLGSEGLGPTLYFLNTLLISFNMRG